ncbi:MAG: response regulator [Candidatus Omnitrophica bacterium]|nr:response regulator [Candidatus Omnitrophota bacterium]
MKALIVDDSKVMRTMIQKGLRQAEYVCEVVEAGDGIEALAKLDASIDVVLLDWKMPNMDGIEFIQKTRKSGNNVPIMMITTEGAEDRVAEAMKEGANGYIIKPFTAEKIKEKLKDILKG